jgi:hypothetical protein
VRTKEQEQKQKGQEAATELKWTGMGIRTSTVEGVSLFYIEGLSQVN